MFEQQHTERLRDFALVEWANGAREINIHGVVLPMEETTEDGTNLMTAIFEIIDTMTEDETARFFEDTAYGIDNNGAVLAEIIEDELETARNGFEFETYEDGSVAVIPATVPAVTVTELVTTRHADGTITRAVQTVADAHAVIAKGHATLIALAENGDIETDFEDVHEFETLDEN